MEVQNLMVNDWVLIKSHDSMKKDQTCKILTISDTDSDNDYGHHYGHATVSVEWEEDGEIMSDPYYDCESQYIEPVPITKEILVNNGFKECPLEYGVEWKVQYGSDLVGYAHGTKIAIYKYKKSRKIKAEIVYVPAEISKPEGGRINIYVNNVHDLQQAMRVCCLSEMANNFQV